METDVIEEETPQLTCTEGQPCEELERQDHSQTMERSLEQILYLWPSGGN